jgi:hypothetical protein
LNQILSDTNNINGSNISTTSPNNKLTSILKQNNPCTSSNNNESNLSLDKSKEPVINELTQINYLKNNYNIEFYKSDFLNYQSATAAGGVSPQHASVGNKTGTVVMSSSSCPSTNNGDNNTNCRVGSENIVSMLF